MDETHDRSIPARKVQIFAVDDQPLVIKGIKMLVNLEPDLEVCGQALGTPEAKRQISDLLPDLIIVDLTLEEGDGIELIDWLRHRHPQMKIVVFTSHGGAAFTSRSLDHGAHGYVVKNDGTHELVRAIRKVVQGERYISNNVAHPGLKFRETVTRAQN